MPQIGCQWKAQARDDSCLVRTMTILSLGSIANFSIVTAFGMTSNIPTNISEATLYDFCASFVKLSSLSPSSPPRDLVSNTDMPTFARMPSMLLPQSSNTRRVSSLMRRS